MAMMMGKESTLSEYIRNYRADEVRYDTYFSKNVAQIGDRKLILNDESILNAYDADLAKYLTSITLTTEEVRKYAYNPKFMSYDIYGTTEYWFLLLKANQLVSVTQFNINPVKIYTIGVINVLSRIVNLQRDIIDENAAKVQNLLQTQNVKDSFAT